LSLYGITTGNQNTAMGDYALSGITTGNANVGIGAGANDGIRKGNENISIGLFAGRTNDTANYNIAIGSQAALYNRRSNITAVGYQSLANNSFGSVNLNEGSGNTALGSQSLFNNTKGSNNTAVGNLSLFQNTTVGGLTAVGYKALFTNTTGTQNTAIGDSALLNNNTGGANTATGNFALRNNSSGALNTATGVNALIVSNGNDNTADGVSSLVSNTSGNQNTAVGSGALYDNTSGSGNTAIGYLAGVNGPGTYSNATAIGYQARVAAANTVQIGNGAVTDIYFGNSFANLHGNLISPSDARFKYNVKANVPGLDFIKKLTPVTYYFDEQKLEDYHQTGILHSNIVHPASLKSETVLHSGFLAQDVEKAAKELGYNFDGVHAPANDKDHYSLAYSQFIMPLVKGMQEQQIIIDIQKNEIDNLKAEMSSQTKDMLSLKQEIEFIKNIIKH
ncbi:MAG: tail fiber domain-containing protein, partial [Ferruginibacter sp.]